MVTKKQKAKKVADFQKVKLKVGKKLKKTGTTDTTIQAKKLVLTSQLEEKTETHDIPLSYRGHSLDELCKQLGHFNKSIRKEALVGTKQLLTSRPDLIATHLRTLIPSIARLISDNNDPQVNSHLKALLAVVCTAPPHCMSAHFTLFVAHLLRALTHMELSTRVLSLSVLSMVMTSYPKLSRSSMDLFQSFIKFLASPRKPNWNSPKFLETIEKFILIFDCSRCGNDIKKQETTISIDNATVHPRVNMVNIYNKSNPFDFPVVSSSITAAASPFELPQSIISLSTVLVPIIATAIIEDKGGAFIPAIVSILESVDRTVKNQPNAFLIDGFNSKIATIWNPVKKASGLRKCEKIRKAAQWIN